MTLHLVEVGHILYTKRFHSHVITKDTNCIKNLLHKKIQFKNHHIYVHLKLEETMPAKYVNKFELI